MTNQENDKLKKEIQEFESLKGFLESAVVYQKRKEKMKDKYYKILFLIIVSVFSLSFVITDSSLIGLVCGALTWAIGFNFIKAELAKPFK